MGIVNVTPDSFSDGGLFCDPRQAVAHGRRLIAEGADLIDVGGESTRPGAEPESPTVEAERVLPVIEALSRDVRVSVDTTKAEVANLAVDAGATLINDVSASLHQVAASRGVGWVAMHMQGEPRTMQDRPTYDDVVIEVRNFLTDKAEAARGAGVPAAALMDLGGERPTTVLHGLDDLLVGAPGAKLTQSGADLTTGNTAWVQYTDSYKIPAGQTTTRSASRDRRIWPISASSVRLKMSW